MWLWTLSQWAASSSGTSSSPLALPDNFAVGNGRIEATEIDIATKTAGRIKEILVNDGDVVAADQVVARMDTQTLEAELRQAQAQVRQAQQAKAPPPVRIPMRCIVLDIAPTSSAKLHDEQALRAVWHAIVRDTPSTQPYRATNSLYWDSSPRASATGSTSQAPIRIHAFAEPGVCTQDVEILVRQL